jgi:exopolyphosphatase / guanosine-5'-triphosphate,3'-diphosphate pyrophosphatase
VGAEAQSSKKSIKSHGSVFSVVNKVTLMQRIGIIDLGSNTTRLIVMGYLPHHSFRLLDEVRESVRLAEGIGADGKLKAAPMARAIATMRLFHQLCQGSGVELLIPAATSAVREASNRAEFLARVERESGICFRVLSTEEEAYYGYLGVANSLNIGDAYTIDIGGGSTQVTLMRGRRFVRTTSQPIGALRLTDQLVTTDPISTREFQALEQTVAAHFANVEWLRTAGSHELAGIGGTIRTLADIDRKLASYPLGLTHSYRFPRSRLTALIERLRTMTLEEREQLPGLNKDRADLILAGAVILHTVMERGQFEQLVVSGQGVREGLFYEHFLAGENPPLLADLRTFSVHNMARTYNYEAIHAAKVRELALSLFDQLTPLHHYGAWERELLSHAALLHDIGLAVGYYDHHRHGEYLLLNMALSGFSHREQVILALLVRYHRKGDIAIEEFRSVLYESDTLRLARLAALLRLAEFLERRKSQVIHSLQVEIGSTVRVLAHTNGAADIEIWDANRSTGLFRKAYSKDIDIMPA